MTDADIELLYADMRPRILGTLRSHGTLPLDQLEDILQEAFEALLKAVRYGDDITDPAEWLMGVVRHKATDRLRHPRTPLGPDGHAGGALPPNVSDPRQDPPLSIVTDIDTQGRLRELFDGLPERDQNVVKLRDWDDLSFADVARRLSITEANARQIYGRACQSMGRRLCKTSSTAVDLGRIHASRKPKTKQALLELADFIPDRYTIALKARYAEGLEGSALALKLGLPESEAVERLARAETLLHKMSGIADPAEFQRLLAGSK